MNITTMTAARNMEMFIMTTKNTGKLTTMKMLLKVRNFFYFVLKTRNVNLWTFSADQLISKIQYDDVGRVLVFWPQFYMVVLGIVWFFSLRSIAFSNFYLDLLHTSLFLFGLLFFFYIFFPFISLFPFFFGL